MSPVTKLSDSDLYGNRVTYTSMLAGNPTFIDSSFDLLETSVLAGSASSVQFTNLTTNYAGTYQHLQLRMVVRTETTAGERSVVYLRLNGDTGNNYSRHVLFSSDGAGSVVSTGNANINYLEAPPAASALNSAGVYSGIIFDLLDPFETTKNKASRSIGGFMGTSTAFYHKILLASSARYNTESITSILIDTPGTSFSTGSRFSLYGVK